MRKPFDLTLYLVTDRSRLTDTLFLRRIEAALANGVTIIQLREKNIDTRTMISLATEVKKRADFYGVPLIIDDRVDVALAVDAAGVHLGSADMEIKTARQILGPDKIIGATAKTVDAAIKAKANGADYFGVGAIFPTKTKVKTVITPVARLNDIYLATQMPIVAIGGLNESNIHVLKGSHARGIAVVRAIMDSDNPAEPTILLREMVDVLLDKKSEDEYL